MNQQLSTATTTPTRVRYGVLGFACTLSMITYLDRVCFGSAVPHIISDLGLTSEADLKWAFTAFAFAYAAFEIPTGWLGDMFGPRKTLIRIVIWWSVFTVLTGLVPAAGFSFLTGLGLLILIRFLFGMGEAGAYPNITRALHNWLPVTERGLGQGAVWMSGRLMGGLTPLVWMFLVDRKVITWRVAFFVFGIIGAIWCIAFAFWFRNRPEEKAQVNDAERELIRRNRDPEADHAHVPWLTLLSSGNLWALCLMYFCAAYGWYFNITYLHRYIETQFPGQLDPAGFQAALYKGGPLWMGAITCLVGGFLTDRFVRITGDRKWGRRLFGLIGHFLCGICYLLCIVAPTATTFFLAISMAAFWNDLTMGAAWATCQDIGRRYAAIVAGCMNTVGNLGGAAAGWATGMILERNLERFAAAKGTAVADLSTVERAAGLLPGYQTNFIIFASVYFIALLFWMRVDATKPVVPEN